MKFNLVLIHVPGRQDIGDFLTIRNMLVGKAPDIRVMIITAGQSITPEFLSANRERPSIVFSPMALQIPDVLRGTRLSTRPLTKLQEYRLLLQAGLPTPRTALLREALDANAPDWSSAVVVKPNQGMRGTDVRLFRTRCLPDLKPQGNDPGGPSREWLVQEWIDTGPYPSSYRIMTVLGQVIYCIKSVATAKVDSRIVAIPDRGIPIAANGQERSVSCVADSDVVELAGQVHQCLTHTPVMGIDIVRERDSGKLFVLELNSVGQTWHLSSDHGKEYQRKYGLDLYGQFNGLARIAQSLIDATRQLAS